MSNEIRVIAWTGGSSPPVPLPEDAQKLTEKILADDVKIYTDFWGSEPNLDIMGILLRRAEGDAWATLRHKYE